MPEEVDRERVWRIGSVPAAPPEAPLTTPSATQHWTLQIGEQITDNEYASYKANVGFLMETFSGSSFAELQRRTGEFESAVSGLIVAFEDRQATPQLVQE